MTGPYILLVYVEHNGRMTCREDVPLKEALRLAELNSRIGGYKEVRVMEARMRARWAQGDVGPLEISETSREDYFSERLDRESQ